MGSLYLVYVQRRGGVDLVVLIGLSSALDGWHGFHGWGVCGMELGLVVTGCVGWQL